MIQKSKKSPRRKPLNQCSTSYQYKQIREIATEFHRNLDKNNSQNFVEDNDVSSES